MSVPTAYAAIMAQKEAIMREAIGIDYAQYVTSPIAFDYERLFTDTATTWKPSVAFNSVREWGTRRWWNSTV